MNGDEMERQIRAHAQKVAIERSVLRRARLDLQVSEIILAAGGRLTPQQSERNLLWQIYQNLRWERDGHR